MLRTLPILFALGAAVSVVPGSADVDAGVAAFERGDVAAAERHFAAALERTTDPGLVAFDLGVLSFHRKEYAEAERHFTRSLDDDAAPAERRARAWFNRGACLLHRGGLAETRTAVDSFERSLALAGEGELRTAAEESLELAKLRWAEERAKAKEPPKPNDALPDDVPERTKPDPKKGDDPGQTPKPGEGDQNPGSPKAIESIPGQPPPNSKAKPTEKTQGGRGNLAVRIDAEKWKPKDEAEAREYLGTLGRRLSGDRRSLAEVNAPPERADVKDW